MRRSNSDSALEELRRTSLDLDDVIERSQPPPSSRRSGDQARRLEQPRPDLQHQGRAAASQPIRVPGPAAAAKGRGLRATKSAHPRVRPMPHHKPCSIGSLSARSRLHAFIAQTSTSCGAPAQSVLMRACHRRTAFGPSSTG